MWQIPLAAIFTHFHANSWWIHNRIAVESIGYMKFSQLDHVLELEPGKRIRAVKRLSPDEQYLKDHFPRFPVMPGVIMLEALYQACCWLVRQSEGFAHSVVLLKEARNVKYSGFVAPGQTMSVTAEILKQDELFTTLKAQGTVNESVAVTGRLVLERFNLADRHPLRKDTDPYTRNETRKVLAKLMSPPRGEPG
ncbi:MAG: 3-hydroxyacyl-ACP dehydratase FabZ family protein [Pirellulaceae bacterium]